MQTTNQKILIPSLALTFVVVLAGCHFGTRHYHPAPVAERAVTLPQSQTIDLGTNAVYPELVVFVAGINCKPTKFHHGEQFQWFLNGSPIDTNRAAALNIGGATTSTLTITNADTNHVGFYQCAIQFTNSDGTLLTDAGELSVAHHSVLTVFGTPIGGSGGGSSACPPKYLGYVNYRLTNSPYGWYCPTGAVAVDPNRSDTVVAYFGSPLSNYGCGSNKVYVPSGTTCAYRFTIYFTNAPVPTGPYSLIITN